MNLTAGTMITCEKGHPVMRVGRTISQNDPVASGDFCNVQPGQPVPHPTEPVDFQCGICGADFIKAEKYGLKIHTEDGWWPN